MFYRRQLRDITINYRDRAMFKLDPHVDPPEVDTRFLIDRIVEFLSYPPALDC